MIPERTIPFVMLAAILTLVVGCGSGTSTQSSAGQSPAAPAPEVKVQNGEAAAIPDDFPKDVPLYKAMDVLSVTTLTGGKTYVIQGSTPDAFEQVDMSMKHDAEANGWQEPATGNSVRDTKMSVRNYSKEGRTLNITLFQQDANTVINISTNGT
ncbi:MAG: hypothetical protein K1Y02_11130 [Candidatus Hydrogenedentes bacterium]|nr:hypothetical protein [Candidatus Hydrogenedentota bacterium]